jgi:hypothetical protein
MAMITASHTTVDHLEAFGSLAVIRSGNFAVGRDPPLSGTNHDLARLAFEVRPKTPPT